MANSSRRERIDPIWWAPVLVLVIAAITALTALLFSGTLRKTVPLTLVSDRAGLVIDVRNGALHVELVNGKRHWVKASEVRARDKR